jgi:hypothetical protein
VILAVGGAWLVWLGRDHWFVADEWAFITKRGFFDADVGLFAPHMQHWVTGPVLVYRTLLNSFGLGSYLPLLVTSVLVHLAVVHLAWRVAVRAGAARWVATGLAALLLVASPTAPEAFHAFQITLNGSVAFGLGLLLLADHGDPLGTRRGVTTALVAVVSLTFSAVSVPLIAVAALLLALRRGWKVALAVFTPSGVVFVVWYLAAGRETISEGDGRVRVTGSALRAAPDFVWQGLRHSVGDPTRFHGAWSALVLAAIIAVAGIVWLRAWRGPALIAAASGTAAVLFFAVTALGRADFGPDATRYLYVAGALMLPVVALAVDVLWRRGIFVQVAILVLLAGLVLVNARDTRRVALEEGTVDQTLRRELLTVAAAVRADPAAPGAVVPQIQTNPDLTVAKLRSLIRSGWFPGGRADESAFPDADVFPYISVTARPTGPTDADAPDVGAGSTTAPVTAGCTVVPPAPTGRAVLRAEAPASVKVTAPNTTSMLIWAADPAGNIKGLVLRRDLLGGRPVWVNLDRPQAIAIVPYYGTFTVCGVDPESPTP